MKCLVTLAAVVVALALTADARPGGGRGGGGGPGGGGRGGGGRGGGGRGEGGRGGGGRDSAERPMPCRLLTAAGELIGDEGECGEDGEDVACAADAQLTLNDVDGNLAYQVAFCATPAFNMTAFLAKAAEHGGCPVDGCTDGECVSLTVAGTETVVARCVQGEISLETFGRRGEHEHNSEERPHPCRLSNAAGEPIGEQAECAQNVTCPADAQLTLVGEPGYQLAFCDTPAFDIATFLTRATEHRCTVDSCREGDQCVSWTVTDDVDTVHEIKRCVHGDVTLESFGRGRGGRRGGHGGGRGSGGRRGGGGRGN